MASKLTLLSLVLTLTPFSHAAPDLCTTQFGYEEFIENISENTPQNTVLGHVNIKGTDSEIALEYVKHEYFLFDTDTRNVTLIKALDTDEGSPPVPKFVVRCYITATNEDIDIEVKVIVVDYNDNAPEFTKTHHTTSIPEDSLVGAMVYSGITATDRDKAFTGNSRIEYRIVNGTVYADYFALNVPTKPDITLAKQLDYETVQKIEILIEAWDNPNSADRGTKLTSTATLTINVIDADDQNPEFSAKSYRGSISQDAVPGTEVVVSPQIVARDPDSMNVSVTYRILDPYEFFTINNTTAVVRSVKPLYVDFPTLTVVVMASQVDDPNREWFAMLTISITEANINAPVFAKEVYEVTKTELEPVGSILITTTATDRDFGTIIHYAIINDTADLSIDTMGNIRLENPLDFEVEHEKNIHVTASDGVHKTTASVRIIILNVNDNNPQLHLDAVQFQAERQTGYVITTITASDADVNDTLTLEIKRHTNLFGLRTNGELYVKADPSAINKDQYSLLIVVRDQGLPQSRESSALIEINFPALNPGTTVAPPIGSTKPSSDGTTTQPIVLAATAPQPDNMLTIILGALAGFLLIMVIILIVCIIWRNKRTKEQLDRARAPRGHSAKGLTYRQAEQPDDLPKMDLGYTDEPEHIYDIGATTVQQNPLRDSGVNQGYLQSSGSEMDRDIGEIEIETAVVPYDDDFGYPSKQPEYPERFRTFHGDDTTSNDSSHSDSTGGSQRVLVNGKKNAEPKLTSWDSDDKIHPQGPQKLMDAAAPVPPKKKEKPEITVYF